MTYALFFTIIKSSVFLGKDAEKFVIIVNTLIIKYVSQREVYGDEDDISAEEEIKIQSSWFQSKNEHSRRKKSISCQKSKRKKTVISLGRIYVAFSSIYY